jgi:hypothetical protein
MNHPRPGLKYVDADDLDKSACDFDKVEVVDPAGNKLGKVEGFIIDVTAGRPFHVVVEAGNWFKHKHFLLPIGHVALEGGGRRMTADVAKSRVERFPGFSRGEFEKLDGDAIDRMAQTSASVCCDEAIDVASPWESWAHYEYPSWWDASFYRPERIGNRDEAGLTSPQPKTAAADRGRS